MSRSRTLHDIAWKTHAQQQCATECVPLINYLNGDAIMKMEVEKGGGGWVAAAMHAKSRFFYVTLQNSSQYWMENSPTATMRHRMCSPNKLLKWWCYNENGGWKRRGRWVDAAMHAKSRFFNITLQKTWCDNSPTATISHTMCSPQDTIGMVMLGIGMVVEEWGGMSLDVWRCTENHDRSKNTILPSIKNTRQ